MPAKKYIVTLSDEERQQLLPLTRKGVHPTRMVTRARILLLADEKHAYDNIATYLHCSRPTVTRICSRYCAEGLFSALREKPRSGAPGKIHGRFEATVTALACSTPPAGHARWTLHLLVELGFIEQLSHTTVNEILSKIELKPWQKKQWCIGELTTEFLWRMDKILDLYEQPYNPKRPQIYFDERPCQLIDDVLTPLYPWSPANPYGKITPTNATACVLSS